jgi:hypothetical protein
VTPVFAGEPEVRNSTGPPVFLSAGDMALPANAQPGKCYARAFADPTYRTETEQVLGRQASERIELIPAQTEMVEQQVLIRAAYQREEVIPAQFDAITEQILVKPASTRWKKGHGLVEKVNNFTGEIMCLEEVPAEYKTVTRQMVTAPARTTLVQVPAEYKTVMVYKIMVPATENRISIPAEYQTVSKTVLASEGKMVWQEVLCETNTPGFVPAKPESHAVPQGEQGFWSGWFNHGTGAVPIN